MKRKGYLLSGCCCFNQRGSGRAGGNIKITLFTHYVFFLGYYRRYILRGHDKIIVLNESKY